MDLHQFLGILRARWRFVTLVMAVGALTTAVFIVMTPYTYASTATLLVSTPPSGVLDPYGSVQTAQQRAQSYANLATDAEFRQQVGSRLDGGLGDGSVSAEVIPQTLLLRVNAVAGSPERAQQIATVAADEIIRMVKELETPANPDIPAPIVASLASKATVNPVPVAPNIPLNIVSGILLSLLVSVAGAVLRDSLDTYVRTSHEVEELTGHSPLAVLPFDASVQDQPLTSDDVSASLAEAFRVLRTNLNFANLDAKNQTMLVTSSVPDEGKTFVAANLASAMAGSGRSVLVLDADMRNPNVADLLGLENAVGMITVLLGRATLDQAIQVHPSGLHFLGTGPQPPNPSEVLDTQAMRSLLATLRDRYEVVIVDAPPLLPVADSAILATEVDGVLLLVRHGATHREQLRMAVARLNTVGGRLLGTVINQAPMHGVGQYGYGYYGYGYGYGFGDADKTQGQASGRRATKDRGRRARR
ncbi:MAG TPA: polysaccharide biosynthesis tyrosine autokinase [Aeromicrobium sp.]|nr:polysaccharide biosynthesis tyrosine autokinase [Aeromicrobium sp.]